LKSYLPPVELLFSQEIYLARGNVYRTSCATHLQERCLDFHLCFFSKFTVLQYDMYLTLKCRNRYMNAIFRKKHDSLEVVGLWNGRGRECSHKGRRTWRRV